MATARKPAVRFNKELRKAIHSGDGYDDYMTLYQFEKYKLSVLNQRIRRMQHAIDEFFDDDGEIDHQGQLFEVSLGETKLKVLFDDAGEVTDYSLTGIKGRRDVVDRIMGLFFSVYLLPVYKRIIAATEEQLADLENDSILKGMCEIRDIIRGDRYLTSFAVSGTDLSSEADDLYELFGGE